MPTKQQLETALVNADKAGDIEAVKQLATAIKNNRYDDNSFFGAGVVEPLAAIASGVGATALGGLVGSMVGADPTAKEGTAAKTVEAFQRQAYQPKTQAGKEGLENVGNVVDFATKVLNIPASGIAGFVSLVKNLATTQDLDKAIDQATQTVKGVQDGGISKFLGGETIEATDSPLAATLVETGVGAIPDLLALKGGAKAIGSISPAVKETVSEAAKKGATATEELVSDISKAQLPSSRETAKILQSGEIDADTALYKTIGEGITNPTKRQKFLGLDAPKLVKDKDAENVARHGFSNGLIDATKKAATNADLEAMKQMTNISRRSKKDPVFSVDVVPRNVIGDILLNKINDIKKVNRESGKAIGDYSRILSGKKFPVASIGDGFKETLSTLKVKITPDNKLDFSDSIVSGAGRRKAIQDIYGRMIRNKDPDALDLHELKQYIDETVSYGKSVRGLGGKAESALKELRTNIKKTLDEEFPEYAEANKTYSDTITILDEVQRLAGKNTDLTSDSAGGALASLTRRITSEAQSASAVREMVNNINKVFDAYQPKNRIGKKPDDVNINLLLHYADELDKVAGPHKTTSFTGGIETAIKASRGPKQMAIEKAEELARAAAGIDEYTKYRDMSKFLDQESKKRKSE